MSDVCSFDVISVFFFKQKTAYEMRISDWSSDVCSSDLSEPHHCTLQLFESANLDLAHAFAADAIDLAQFFQGFGIFRQAAFGQNMLFAFVKEIGRASCRERVCQYV